MDAETEMLLTCARTHLGAGHERRAAELAAGGLDWERLLSAAQLHGLLPLLHRNLARACPERVPDPVADKLQSACRANSATCIRLAGEMLRLEGLFRAQGITAVPYKGPVLASAVYGNVAMRQFGDVDFLISHADVLRARDLLAGLGYRSLHALTGEEELAFLRSAGEVALVRENPELVVELHAELVPPDLRVRLDTDVLLGRTVPAEVLGQQTCTLCPEDLLLVLCVHGSKHGWTSLGWVCDVAELLRANPAMDWDGVAFHAESVRAVRMLNLGLLLAHDLVGEAIPEPLREDLEADVKASRLAAQARDMLLGDPDAVPGLRAITRYHLQLADRLLDGASYCCSMVLTPQPADWKALPLPSRLSFLYRVYRPLRLVYRHAIRPVPGRLSHLIRRG